MRRPYPTKNPKDYRGDNTDYDKYKNISAKNSTQKYP